MIGGSHRGAGVPARRLFPSLTQTAALHGSHPLEMFRALFKSATAAQDLIFGLPAKASLTS